MKSEEKIFRIIDANINRCKEGIRVIEEIIRYLFDNKEIASKLKELRHKIKVENYKNLLQYRDIENDVLKESIESEKDRTNLKDIILANFKRAQESARVLEESFKIIDPQISEDFKHTRYELYSLEKEVLTIYF